MSAPVSVLLVDDHALMRDSLSRRLEAEGDLTVVATVSNADDALPQVMKYSPDIVLMDIDMPGLSSFEAADQIALRRPSTRIIFLSAFFHDSYIERAISVKAKGYLTKSQPIERLIEAIHRVAIGRVYFSDDVRSRIVVDARGIRLASKERTRLASLSPREIEVLRYISRGLSKKEIAPTMHISVKTVEGHTEKLMSKLNIHNRVELARFAIREGIAEA